MKKIWYAVMRDAEDSDWGYGSHNKREAAKMVRKLRREGHPDAFIEIVEMSAGDAVSVGKIHDVRGL